LYNRQNLDEGRYHELLTAQRSDLKTGRAWAIKENISFWSQSSRIHGKRFFEVWYSWAIPSRPDQIKKTARMLKTHSAGLLSYYSHRMTNAITESFNSRIQSLMSTARGFRNFINYQIRLLFFCGKLNLQPELCH
jgi:transposase